MNRFAMIAALGLLAGCGGGNGADAVAGAATGRNALAADACDKYAKDQLGDKTYALDRAVLAASLVPESDGSFSMKGPITIQPGLSSESKQTLECSVRFLDGKPEPDVLRMQFIW